MMLESYVAGSWHQGAATGVELTSAVDGTAIASCSSAGLDFGAMAAYARATGGPALRAMSFHERAIMLKELAIALGAFREEFYALSNKTGATKGDNFVDIDGGLSALFVYSSKGRRELPDETFYIDGETEQISREGSFLGQHIMVPRRGVALHINAFNFPCWGMLEKLAPTLLAGMPAIVKPATATAYLTERVLRRIIETGILPEGAVQLICGSTGDLFDHLACQDVVSFTGSASTAHMLQNHPSIIRHSVPFIAECDSLNASMLGPDITPQDPEFELYIKEVVREMTVKAGQKCTAIRRAIVPRASLSAVQDALIARLEKIVVGAPNADGVRMGPLAGQDQRREVLSNINTLAGECKMVLDGTGPFEPVGGDYETGAFIRPTLLVCDKPLEAELAHSVEAFGPVCTLMPYDSLDDAVTLLNRGGGSLVASLFSYDQDVVRSVVLEAGAFHGRLVVIDRTSAGESTGHGSPLAHLKHGGPGRAGGGEEQGGIRGMLHYMQRVAVQGSPNVITTATNRWTVGADVQEHDQHLFRKNFAEIQVGDTLNTAPRTISLEDIEHFARFTGDTFYAHMDEAAAAANPFFEGRVAHGYLLLSFAAGLFVDPAPGPVLANYGLNGLAFMQPVYPGDEMRVQLTCRQKVSRPGAEYGEVRWQVLIRNQEDELCASYELLTLNALADSAD